MNRRGFVRSCGIGLAGSAGAPGVLQASIFTKDPAKKASTLYVYDERMLPHPHGTETADRLLWIDSAMSQSGLSEHVATGVPLENVNEHLLRVHTQHHVDAILSREKTGPAAKVAVGSVLAAVDAVVSDDTDIRNAFCAIRPPGHHVTNEGGEVGFCFFANVVIAARYIQSNFLRGNGTPKYQRILIIDWDFHHGNSTQYFTYDDPSVLFLSTHNADSYPGRYANTFVYEGTTHQIGSDPSCTGIGPGEGYNINMHFNCGADASMMKTRWEEELFPKLEEFNPDFVLISAGFDSKENDALGCFSISPQGFHDLTSLAMEIADTYCEGRLVSMLEGGYSDATSGYHDRTYEGLAHSATAHVAALTGQPIPDYTSAHDLRTGRVQFGVSPEGILDLGKAPIGIDRVTVYSLNGRRIESVAFSQTGRRIDLGRITPARGTYVAEIMFLDRRATRIPYTLE